MRLNLTSRRSDYVFVEPALPVSQRTIYEVNDEKALHWRSIQNQFDLVQIEIEEYLENYSEDES